MLSSIKFSNTKNPRPGATNTRYAMFDLEDLDGVVRCILWPEQFAKFSELVKADEILAVRGVVERRAGSDEANIIVNELLPLDDLQRRGTKGIVVRINEESHGLPALEQLRELAEEFRGDAELRLLLCLADGNRLELKSDSLRVEVGADLRARIDEILGPGNVRVLTADPAKNSPRPRPAHYSSRAAATAKN
jgi:DNA polymerase-3 subunit alpha